MEGDSPVQGFYRDKVKGVSFQMGRSFLGERKVSAEDKLTLY